MSFISKILGKDDSPAEAGPAAECTHASLVAHWARPEDMGKEELASSWKCTSCGDEFSSDERELFHAAELERVHHYQEEKAGIEAAAAIDQRIV